MAKFKKDKPKSAISKTLEEKKSVNDLQENFKISFQYFDKTQKHGSYFKDWQNCGLLSKALETLEGYCKRPLLEQVDGKKFTIYGDFPAKNKTHFDLPAGIPEDANWARIHVNGKSVIAGHIVKNTFYIVFLDKHHSFYLTKRARGEI